MTKGEIGLNSKAVKSLPKARVKMRRTGSSEMKALETLLESIEKQAKMHGWTSLLRQERLVRLSELWNCIKLEE